MWDERYSKPEYAYGREPNLFLKEQLEKLSPGRILFAAEGEGRNAVYAARMGWVVHAFDQSVEGKRKAELLASDCGVELDYTVSDCIAVDYQKNFFDVIGLIYAHFPALQKSPCHLRLIESLKPGGLVILEAFSRKHLEFNSVNPSIGGPKEAGMLFSKEEILEDFLQFDVLLFEEKTVELHEGLYHNGTGSVIRFVGRKRP